MLQGIYFKRSERGIHWEDARSVVCLRTTSGPVCRLANPILCVCRYFALRTESVGKRTSGVRLRSDGATHGPTAA